MHPTKIKLNAFKIIHILFPGKRPPTKPDRAKESKNSAAGSLNRKANSGTLTHHKHCKSKTKITNQESDSKPCKHISFSLSQPAHSPNSTSSRNVLHKWQPPIIKVCYDHVTKKTAQNLWLQEITPSKGKVCDDGTGNGQTAMDSMDTDAGKMHTESKTVGCNENVEEDKSLSQQSTQPYVCIENERNETQGEKNKYEGNEKVEVKNAVQAAGKEPEHNYVHVTNSSDITAGNIDPDPDPDPLSITHNDEGTTSFTKHFEEEVDRCLISTKHTQNENNQVSTKDEDKEQDMLVNVQEGYENNIMNKSDSIILPPDKNFLPLMYKPSDCEEKLKIKPGYDPVTCHIQSLTAKLPQYTHSMETLIGSEEDSPLPTDLVLKDLIQSQLTGDMAKEIELIKEQPVTPATVTIKISEQKSGTNKCYGEGYRSDDILIPDVERSKNNRSPLVAIDAKQISSSSGNETEHQESSLLTNDLPINKSEVHLVKMIETVTLSPSGAAEIPEICNVNNIKIQTHTECAPKVLSDTNLNNQPKSSKLAMNIRDVKHTILKTNTETENVRTASHLFDAVTAEDYSKSPSELLTAANVSTEEHLIERHEEALDAGPCSVSTKNDMGKPRTDLNIICNCCIHPATNAEGTGDPQEGNEEPPNVHPSTSMKKEFLPKPEDINQSEGCLYKPKDVFCRSPTIAMEAPNILENAAMTNENILNTAGHNYLLDDDIGLTGSQLLRIEDECQYKIQHTEAVRNHASFCGEATVPDTSVLAPKLPPANWAQIMQEKREKLRNIIQDISRLK